MLQSLLALIGRILLSALFFRAVFSYLTGGLDGVMQFMATKLPYVPLFLAGAIFLQLVGGLLLFLGYKTRLGAAMLILFLLSANYIFHDFWNLQGAERAAQQIDFFKNLAVAGGLFAFAAFGPGRWSIDKS
jgi:putative oxidoreductase